jgi:hypothetical protein
MNQEKKPSFLEETLRKVEDICFQNVENVDRLRTELLEFLPEKIKQSFKNGLEAGRRKTGQDKTGKPAYKEAGRKPYRNWRR